MKEASKYPLAQVASIKKRRLDEAEKVLKEKKQLLIKEEEKLALAEQKRNEVKEHRMAKLTQLREKLDEGTTSDKIQQMRHYLKIVEEKLKAEETKVKEQAKQVELAEKQVEIAREDLFKKQKDVEKLSMHHKEWEKEIKHEETRQAGIETDELGSSMHVLKKKSKKK
jgi:flagellar biosynthesis chaperone FliJ